MSRKILDTNQLVFNNTPLPVITLNNQIWITSREIAKALNYSSSKSVTDLYNKYNEEFTPFMSQVVKSKTSGNYRKKTRIFSLRGAHLIAMFSRTPIAKEFRKWVLDILDRECEITKIDDVITPAQKQDLIRAINLCVERIRENCNDISDCLRKRFNINELSLLPSSKFDIAIEFLSLLTKKDVVHKRYFVEVKITDYMFNGEKTILGKCNNFNSLITNLANDLGYKIERLSETPQTLSF